MEFYARQLPSGPQSSKVFAPRHMNMMGRRCACPAMRYMLHSLLAQTMPLILPSCVMTTPPSVSALQRSRNYGPQAHAALTTKHRTLVDRKEDRA